MTLADRLRRLVVTATASLLFVGCGASAAANRTTQTSGSGRGPVIVRATDALRFDQATYRAAAGSVTFTLVDDGHEPHSLVIDGVPGFRLSVRNHDDTDQATTSLAPGTYTMACDIPGHRAAGMTATLVVTAS
jgi:plastocyanin